MNNRLLFTLSMQIAYLILLTGCMQHPSLTAQQRPMHWAQQLNTSNNLYQINDWLYRSEQPLAGHQAELKQLGIDVIINLRSRNRDIRELDAQQFRLIHHPINTWAIDREDLLTVMQHLQKAQQKQQKVLIHCYHGSDRTGAILAMYRIQFEQWPIEDAVREMKYGGYGYHPIWVNIDRLFNSDNVAWIRQQLHIATPSLNNNTQNHS